MPDYEFTLVLYGPTQPTSELEDSLYEAGLDDALLGFRDEVPYLDFDRSGTSLVDVLLVAITAVERSGSGLTVIRVEPDELVTAADIAERTGRTRESVRLLAAGQRGPGGFPAPARGITHRNRLWHWSEVAHWMADNVPGSVTPTQLQQADNIAAVNAALLLRKHDSHLAHGILDKLAG